MEVYIIKIEPTDPAWKGFTFQAIFARMPSQADVMAAIQAESQLADSSYNELYLEYKAAAEQMSWPITHHMGKSGFHSATQMHREYPLAEDRIRASRGFITIEREPVVEN